MTRPSDILPDDPAYSLERHFEYLLKLRQHFPSEEENKERILAVVVKLVSLERVECLMPRLTRFVDRLFYENNIMYRDRLEDLPADRQLYTEVEDQMLDKNREDRAFVAVQRFYLRLFKLLPEFVKQPYRKRDAEGDAEFDESAPTVPFLDVVNPHAVFQIARDEFSVEDKPGRHTFHLTHWKMERNVIRAAGHTPETYRGQSIDIQKCDPQTIFHNTPFEELFEARIEFSIPRESYATHGIILAPPEHGKTQLFGTLIHTLLTGEKTGIILLDPHGDLFQVLKDRVDPSRLIILDPDTDPPPLNFLDFGNSTEPQQLQAFSYLMSSLSGGLSDKQAGIVPYLLKLLRNIPDASLETLRQIVDEKVKKPEQSKFWSVIQQLPVVDQGFFQNQFYSSPMQITKDAIGWKLYSALSSDAFRQMFGSTQSCLDADLCLREQRVVLVKGGRNAIGDAGMQVFLQFVVSQFYSAALRREKIPEKDRSLNVMFVDEAHHVFNPQISNLLVECRKYGLGFIGATQVVQQIPQDVKAAVYGATAIKFAGPVSHTDATILAKEMYTTPEQIRAMKSIRKSHAEWMCHVRNVTDQAVKLTLPFGALESMRAKPYTPPKWTLPASSKESLTEPPTEKSAGPSTTSSRFIPGVGSHVRVFIGGYDWFDHGARVIRIDTSDGRWRCYVDPRPFAQEGDQPHCFKECAAPVELSDLEPYEDDQKRSAKPQFNPRIGMRVHAHVGKERQQWFKHGAKIIDIDPLRAAALLDPRPYTQPGDPPHCFEEPKFFPLRELGPYEEKNKNETASSESKSKGGKPAADMDKDTDY